MSSNEENNGKLRLVGAFFLTLAGVMLAVLLAAVLSTMVSAGGTEPQNQSATTDEEDFLNPLDLIVVENFYNNNK